VGDGVQAEVDCRERWGVDVHGDGVCIGGRLGWGVLGVLLWSVVVDRVIHSRERQQRMMFRSQPLVMELTLLEIACT